MKMTIINIHYRSAFIYNPNNIFPQQEISKITSYMLNNILTEDNVILGKSFLPGAIIASPSVPDDPETDQNYVYDWIRDSAITMREVIALYNQGRQDNLYKIIINYIDFTTVVQNNAKDVTLGYGRWNINATPSRNWSVQNDGPALRIITMIEALEAIGDNAKALACIKHDAEYLCKVYKDASHNIWEEAKGDHFFFKIVARKALKQILVHNITLVHFPSEKIQQIINELEQSLDQHWQSSGYYKSQLDSNFAKGNDINISVVLGLMHGEIEDNDKYAIPTEKSMKTIAKLIEVFHYYYAINKDDEWYGLGPNMGRYPFDNYDGDISDPEPDVGHPWFLCTNTMGYCFYRLAQYAKDNAYILERASYIFNTEIKNYQDLITLGNKFIFATKRHWDNGRMSEQYDRKTGYSKSVRDLTWSYSSYLMAYQQLNKIKN